MPYERQTAFILKICKALYFDYQNFYEVEKWGNPDVLLDAIGFFEKWKESKAPESELENISANIKEVIPDEKKFQTQLTSCAVNASAAIRDAILFLQKKKPQYVLNIATYYCDNAFLLIDEPRILSSEDIDNHPLVVETRNFLLLETA